jgi:hypothetical protein
LELHIGYVYGSKDFPPHASHYAAKYIVGARLPHAWIQNPAPALVKGIVASDVSYISELGPEEVAVRRWSTLDLCRFDTMTLFQADTPSARHRAILLEQLLAETPILGKSSGRILRRITYGVDFETIPGPPGENFVENARLTSALDGGVLVRPDQHILMMIDAKTSAQNIFNAIKGHLSGLKG